VTGPTVRRVRPSDRSWPTAASWEKLKHQVGGQLMPVSSPLAPCRDAPGSAACAARIEEMKNPYFIGEQAGGTQTSGWLEGWTSAPSTYAVGHHEGGPLRPRRRVCNRRCRGTDPKWRLRQLLEELRPGRSKPPASRDRYRRRQGTDRQRLHQSGSLLGVEGRRWRQLRRCYQGDAGDV